MLSGRRATIRGYLLFALFVCSIISASLWMHSYPRICCYVKNYSMYADHGRFLLIYYDKVHSSNLRFNWSDDILSNSWRPYIHNGPGYWVLHFPFWLSTSFLGFLVWLMYYPLLRRRWRTRSELFNKQKLTTRCSYVWPSLFAGVAIASIQAWIQRSDRGYMSALWLSLKFTPVWILAGVLLDIVLLRRHAIRRLGKKSTGFPVQEPPCEKGNCIDYSHNT